MKKLISHITFWEIIFIFIISFTPLLWLGANEIIIGHDSGAKTNGIEYLHDLLFSWSPGYGFGKDWTLNKGFLITKSPEIFFSFVTGFLGYGQRLMFIFWFLVMGLSMYIFAKSFFPEKKYWILRLVSSTFYVYNFYILQAWSVIDRAKFSLYAALPLCLLILYKTLTGVYSIKKGALLFGLVLFFLNGGSSPPLFGALLLSSVIFVIYFTARKFKKSGLAAILYSMRLITGFTIAAFLINSYWTLPQVVLYLNHYQSSLSAVGGISGVLAWEKMTTVYASFYNIFRLQGFADRYDSPPHPYLLHHLSDPFLIILSFLPFGIILFVLTKKQLAEKMRSPIILPLLFVCIVSLIFTSGSKSPFGFIYTSFVEYVPGFAIFRSAFSKFGYGVWFSLIFLCSYSLNVLLLEYIRKKYLYIFLGFISIAAVILYHYPYFSGNFFQLTPYFSTKVTIPRYVPETVSYLNKTTTPSSRVLLLPPLEPTSQTDSYTWGYFSIAPFLRNTISRSIIANEDKAPVIIDYIYQAIRTRNEKLFTRLTQLSGIDTVLWRDDILYENGIKSDKFSFYEENLKTFSNVKNTATFEKWRVYQLSQAQPTVFTTQNIIYTDQISHIGDILEASNLPNNTVLLTPQITGSLSHQKAITASCIYCNPKDELDLQKSLFLPPVRFLPSSIFYSLVTDKENKIQNTFSNQPAALIDAEISFAGKRLSEVSKLIAKNQTSYLPETLMRYNNHMKKIINLMPTLSGKEYNDYSLKLLAYINLHKKTIKSWGLSSKNQNEAVKTISELEDYIKKNIWWTTSLSNAKFIIQVAQADNYNINLSKRNGEIKKINIDGKEVNYKDTFYLSAGDHFIEVVYSNPRKIETNKLDYPVIVLTKNIPVVQESKSPDVLVKRHDSTYYSINIAKSDKPYLLIFGESFGNWVLYPKYSNNNLIDTLISFTKPVSEEKHIKVNGYANAWIMDPDDSGEYMIFYQPQLYSYTGALISLLAFIYFLWALFNLKSQTMQQSKNLTMTTQNKIQSKSLLFSSRFFFAGALVFFITAMLGEILKVKGVPEFLGNLVFILIVIGTIQLLREK